MIGDKMAIKRSQNLARPPDQQLEVNRRISLRKQNAIQVNVSPELTSAKLSACNSAINSKNSNSSSTTVTSAPITITTNETYQSSHLQQRKQNPSATNNNIIGTNQQPVSHFNLGSTLTSVNNHKHNQNSISNTLNTGNYAIPRKSLIGRLERSSFQAQRLSDVGVAFGQQITAKMGLKLPASQERIVEQTRWLYLRYIFAKLRQFNLPLRDLNLTKSSRARRAAALAAELDVPVITSYSAPPSAMVSSDQPAIKFPKSPRPSPSMLSRKRVTLVGSESIDLRELNLLTANRAQETTGALPFVESTPVNSEPLKPAIKPSAPPQGQLAATAAAKSHQQARKYVMDPAINNQIFTVILNIIRELRDHKPDYYGDTINELIGIDKFTSLESLLEAQMTICHEMTRSEISWCRITALFSLFGAMSLDCVRMGAPEHVGPILDGFIGFVERDLALWISQQGGWESFLYKYRAGLRYRPLISRVLAVALPLLIWAVLSFSRW